jgi:hypothetical protein
MASFAVRIENDDEIDLAAFDQAARERDTSREEMVRELMRGFLARLANEEEYYTVKAYSDDHQRYATIHFMDGFVSEHSVGFTDDNNDWRVIEHAKDLVERNRPGDKEAAIKLFQDIFGESNVFVKDE